MQKTDLNLELTDDHAEKFRRIKEKLGIKKDEDVLIYLINDAHQRLTTKTEKGR